jgi:ATP:ADP antiporter, AAA family
MSSTTETAPPDKPGLVDRFLRLFSDVRAGEGIPVLLLLANAFIILLSYYILKTVREPLILATGGAEVKAYASAGQAAVLMVLVPAYAWFTSRVDRMALCVGVTLFFAFCIEAFWLGALRQVPFLGVAFYIWVGIFSLAIIAQFWSYANDVYPEEAGKRLFPVIAIGSAVGSWGGSKIAEVLFKAGIAPTVMLQISAGLLLLSLGLYLLANRRLTRRKVTAAATDDQKIGGGQGAFELIWGNPYLRFIALLLVVLNIVNTTGEYIVSRSVTEAAAQATAGLDPAARDAATRQFIGAFYGRYFSWVNIASFLLQAFVVSRLVKVLGIAGVLLALPLVATGSYALIAMGVPLAIIRWAKTAENATDYSIMNTARALLWLPTTREEKYKAKQAADTFFVRIGDLLSAGLVFVGVNHLQLGVRSFALVNLMLVLGWLALAVLVLREHRRIAQTA